MMEWPTTNVMRAAGEEVRFSCIYKSARKQIVKSALRINVASGLRAHKHQCRGSDVLDLAVSEKSRGGARIGVQ
jgi:hypothetical protein